MATPKKKGAKPRRRPAKKVAKRPARRRAKAPAKNRRRRLLQLLALMLLVSGLLLWGVVSVSQRGRALRSPGSTAAPVHEDGITDADRQRLRQVLESIDDERAKR